MTARRVEDDHQEEGGRKMAARRRMEDDRQMGGRGRCGVSARVGIKMRLIFVLPSSHYYIYLQLRVKLDLINILKIFLKRLQKDVL